MQQKTKPKNIVQTGTHPQTHLAAGSAGRRYHPFQSLSLLLVMMRIVRMKKMVNLVEFGGIWKNLMELKII